MTKKMRFYSVLCIRWSLWAYSAVVVLDDIEVCSNSQGGGGGGGGHIMKLLSLTFVKKFRTACHDVANIFRWQMLKATSTIDPRFQRTTVPPLSTSQREMKWLHQQKKIKID